MQVAKETTMTNLSDFLKTQKVRCVKAHSCCLTVGKEYSVLDIRMEVKVKDDEGDNCYWESEHFEPVLDSAENPLQDVELTPEFGAVEPVIVDNCQVNIQDIGTDILDTNADIKDTPKFEVGDKVYVGLTGKIARVTKIIDDDVVNVANKNNEVRAWISNICHATQENYERLQATFPDIEFEQPPKELKGNDLARAMLINGHKFVVVRDKHTKKIHVVKDFGIETKKLVDASTAELLEDVEPIDPRTGLPLTQAVLDE